MPKRSQPPVAAMPSGQAFRVRAKKQKQDKEAAPRMHDVQTNGKGKQREVRAPGKQSHAPKSIMKKESHTATTNGSAKALGPTVGSIKSSPQPKLEKAAARPAPSKPRPNRPVKARPVPRSFRIIAGSYERLLYGFHVKLDAHQEPYKVTFTPLFSFAAHTSCISAVAAAGIDSKWLATGAGDETIRVWDLRKRKEVGGLTGHGGTIHSLSFPSRAYLLSSDSNGLINVYRTRDWALLKSLRGHTGRVNKCVAHPSGKVALSVGQDCMLRMWDLMRGKGAGAVRLRLGEAADEAGSALNVKDEPLDIQWSPNGQLFVVMGRQEVSIYKLEMTRVAGIVVRKDDSKNRFGCVAWLGNEIVLAGTESGIVNVYRINAESLGEPICKLIGHDNRVKAVQTMTVQPDVDHLIVLAVTASTDGNLRIFDVSDLMNGAEGGILTAFAKEKSPLHVHSTDGARLTCLDVVGGSGVRTGAQDSIDTDVDDADDDDDDGSQEDGKSSSDDEQDVEQAELDQTELQELNDLLDFVEEAKAQGLDIDGLSEFMGSDEEEDVTDPDEDDNDLELEEDDSVSNDEDESEQEEEES